MNSLPLFIFSAVRSGEPIFITARLRCRERPARAGPPAVRGHPLPRPRQGGPSMKSRAVRAALDPARAGARSSCAGSARRPAGRRQPRADPGLGLQLVGQRGQPVDRRRAAQRPAGRLLRHRFGPGPQGLRVQDDRLRGQRHRLPGQGPGDRRETTPRSAARSPTCRSSRAARPSRTRSRSAGSWSRTCGCPGLTLAKIFTNQITNWNDPAITADNNGRKLPSLPIIPVVHSEGSGSSAQFTRYLDTVYPSIWRPFLGAGRRRRSTSRARGRPIAQNGSDGVMNFVVGGGRQRCDRLRRVLVRARARTGRWRRSRTGRLLHAAHPVQRRRRADQGDHQQRQERRRTTCCRTCTTSTRSTTPRTYPLSSYSYMIIPTASNDRG